MTQWKKEQEGKRDTKNVRGENNKKSDEEMGVQRMKEEIDKKEK